MNRTNKISIKNIISSNYNFKSNKNMINSPNRNYNILKNKNKNKKIIRIWINNKQKNKISIK